MSKDTNYTLSIATFILFMASTVHAFGVITSRSTHGITSIQPQQRMNRSLLRMSSTSNQKQKQQSYPLLYSTTTKLFYKTQDEDRVIQSYADVQVQGMESSTIATVIEEKNTMNKNEIDLTKEKNMVFSESTLRSLVKALTWRVVAGSVTFITSLKLSGSIALALKIVASDFLSKALTMFIGERIMNKSQAGRKSGSDSASRSITKALIWRLFAVCNTMTAALLLGGGNLKIASKIAGSDAMFKTGLMVAYERVWARIDWGKEYEVAVAV